MKMSVVLNDPAIVTRAHGDMKTFSDGLQPFLYASREGTLLAQGQTTRPTKHTRRMNYHSQQDTLISRDGGKTYQLFTFVPGQDDPFFEGGMTQLADGAFFGMDTYIVPEEAGRDGWGEGEAWISRDDLRTFEGPIKTTFHIPKIDFYSSRDDGGGPHTAARLHRSILELPDGTMLATLYCIFKGDCAPCGYTPSMMKMRVVVVRSVNKGLHWDYAATVATDIGIGTEGFGEPCVVRIEKGNHAGRLLCMMRTGRDMYEAFSDDDGSTWSDYRIVRLPIDIYAVNSWREQFGWRFEEAKPEMRSLAGAIVDPDIIQMENGLLAMSFGVRVPEKLCWEDPSHPVNGVYCAFSKNSGDTWSHVIQLLSGEMTTHYTALRECGKNRLVYHYDAGVWNFWDDKNKDKYESRHGRACFIDVEYAGG